MGLSVFASVVLMVLLGIIFLGERKKAKPSSVNSLFDDEELRESIKEETESSSLIKGKVVPFVQEHNSFFSFIYKIFLIDIEKNETMLYRANNRSRTGEELSVIQLMLMFCAIFSLFFFTLVTSNLLVSILTCVIFLMVRVYTTIKYTSDHKRLRREFSKDLPDFLNAIQIPIENGGSPDDVFKKVALEWDGVLGSELQGVVRESANYGNMLYRPLEELASKIGYQPFTNFVHSFNTSLKTGVNMSLFISKLCDEMRFQSHNDVLEANRKKSSIITIITGAFILFPLAIMIMVPQIVSALKSIN